MKTLKYLMLLLAVTVAFPAAAQVKATKATEALPKDKAFLTESTEKAVFDKGEKKATKGVAGKLSDKTFYTVAVEEDGTFHATAGTKKVTLELFKNGNTLIKRCSGLKAACPSDFTYVSEAAEAPAAEEEMADVQDEIPWDAYSEEVAEEAWAEEAAEEAWQ